MIINNKDKYYHKENKFINKLYGQRIVRDEGKRLKQQKNKKRKITTH